METNLACAFCHEKRNGDMLARLDCASMSTGYYDEPELENVDFVIQIHCHKCEKLLYAKEVIELPHDYQFHKIKSE